MLNVFVSNVSCSLKLRGENPDSFRGSCEILQAGGAEAKQSSFMPGAKSWHRSLHELALCTGDDNYVRIASEFVLFGGTCESAQKSAPDTSLVDISVPILFSIVN